MPADSRPFLRNTMPELKGAFDIGVNYIEVYSVKNHNNCVAKHASSYNCYCYCCCYLLTVLLLLLHAGTFNNPVHQEARPVRGKADRGGRGRASREGQVCVEIIKKKI